MSKPEDFTWHSLEELAKPKESHALIHLDLWCVANDNDEVAIYKDFSIQGNKHKSITERLLKGVPGGTKIIFVPVVILRDSPSRYY